MHLSTSNSETHCVADVRATRSEAQFSLELGMPHLGRHNLSESALFKAIGQDRWKRIEELGGLRSALIYDEDGNRLYATFYLFEIDLPRSSPLSSFGENCTLHFVSDLAHYSKVYLDGCYVLAGHPHYGIRASNVFIYQERGPAKLSTSIPAKMNFSQIQELAAPPDSLGLCRQARAQGAFYQPEPADIAVFEGEREFVYRIDPDRDLNGAGLIYFANFVSFLDAAERELLSGFGQPVPTDLLDLRSTYRRRVGYFGNAQSTDALHIFLRARGHVALVGDRRVFDFGFDYRIRRSSDNKEILVSSARKVSPLEGTSIEWAHSRSNAPSEGTNEN